MSEDPDVYRVRWENCQSKLNALEANLKPAIERVKMFKKNFGVREKQDGEIDVDFEKFARNIGMEGALELRQVIDEIYQISGGPGEKPKVKVAAGSVE